MINRATTIAELNEIETGFRDVVSTDQQKEYIIENIQARKNVLMQESDKLFVRYKNRIENAESQEQLNSIRRDLRTANSRDSEPRLTDEHFSALMNKSSIRYNNVEEIENEDDYVSFANDIKNTKSTDLLDYLYNRLYDDKSFKNREHSKLAFLISDKRRELEGVDSGANTAE